MKLIGLHSFDLKYLNGFLPVNKPRGICCNKLMHALRADVHFVLHQHNIKHGAIEIFYAKALEPFASGLLTFILGTGNYRKRNFIFADYLHRATVEFGVERESHLIGGPILCRTKTDHIDCNTIESALENFRGTIMQSRSKFMDKHDDPLELSEKLASFEGIYDLMKTEDSKSPKIAQKYPCELPPREVTCQDIKLVEYKEPFATFDINSIGGFSVRQFVSDLGERLETKASLTDLIRLKEGPMNLDDPRVTQIHETQVEHYFPRINLVNKLYNSYTSMFDDLFEGQSYRPRM